MSNQDDEERPFGSEEPTRLELTVEPLFGLDDEVEATPGVAPVHGYDVAWATDSEPIISFIPTTEVRRDFGGTMLLFAYGDRSGGLWIACDEILWMRPATRAVDSSLREVVFKLPSRASYAYEELADE